MSKIDIGVGDEFPLDEGRPWDDRHAWKEEYRARRREFRHHRRMHRHHGHHHYRRHGFSRLPFLLVIAGVIALIVNHQLTAPIAYGMIGAGIGLLALMFLVHAIWRGRHHRGPRNTPSQAA